ncbi:Trz1p [Sugiyamaella lignohabitans]|uniref:ribonuclease Z n=1 Tax=Sugiyamaella lignohabitans TaxID=796027 RepID=A0A167CBN7_9ASCO|nr:Trz1p [Sugiyamaella lignohabitans]ANB11474.1 Trz1p [Sugiyamaella lignohabitans]
MAKLQHIFLTGTVSWDTVGGLPGFLLTFGGENQGRTSVQSASVNIEPVKQSWRHFIFHEGLDVDLRSPGSTFQDELIAVEGVGIKPSLTSDSKSQSGPKRRETSAITSSSFASPQPASSYIVQILPSRGKFLVEKARELGVPKGVMYRELTEGRSVITPDGRTVHPHEVMEPAKTPPRVLVIDCPSNEYVDGVVTFPWDKHLTRKRKYEETDDNSDISSVSSISSSTSSVSGEPYDIDIKVVYHFLGESVNPFEGKYYEFITKLAHNNVLQYFCHPHYSPNTITLESLALLNDKLRNLFPSNFKKLYSIGSKLDLSDSVFSSSILDPASFKLLKSLDITTLEPQIKHEAVQDLKSTSTSATASENVNKKAKSSARSNGNGNGNDTVDMEPGAEKSADAGSTPSKDLDVSSLNVEPIIGKVEGTVESDLAVIDEPQVITLGTGSSQPSKYRNVSCTVVRVPFGNSSKAIMFDCGEGTLGSIKRNFGPVGTEKLLRELDVLYISHLHADHHLGSLSVIDEWLRVNEGNNRQLALVAPGPFKSFVAEWAAIMPTLNMGLETKRIIFIDCARFIYGKGYYNAVIEERDHSTEDDISAVLSGTKIETCRAIHCDLAYCVSVTFTDTTFKVSYSGDSRPNMFFARTIGADSDMLIHEATHENELAEEAKAKRHSTIGEAISVSRAMRAKATILTHFSQRYPKLPELGDVDILGSPLALAFDGMQMLVSEVPNQLKQVNDLRQVFAETEAQEEQLLD